MEVCSVAESLSIVLVNHSMIFEILLGLEEIVAKIFFGGSRHWYVRRVGGADSPLGPEVIVGSPSEHQLLEAKSQPKMKY